jgi:hypothetical protein
MLISAFFSYATIPGPNLLITQLRYKLLAGYYTVFLVVQLVTIVAASEAGVVAVAAAVTATRTVELVSIAYLATRVRSPGDPETSEAVP